jgi:hypothetical protein
MQRIAGGALVLLATAAAGAKAQLLRPPEFSFEPGVITVNAVSPPNKLGSSTGLNLRFVATIPTQWSRVSVLIGTAIPPLGLSNGRDQENSPSFFYGITVPIITAERTNGWLDLNVPVLGLYELDNTGLSKRFYVNDFGIETTLKVNIGRKLMGDLGGFWSRFTAYLVVQQNLSPGRDVLTGRLDRFDPVLQYGVTIPISGRRTDQ